MITIESIKELQEHLLPTRESGSIGFVPTMGALHAGHISLVKQSVSENSTTVVSIYVNPTQFNNKSDLDRYPRNIDADIELLQDTGCSIVFAPTNIEMYPKPDNRTFDFGDLETVMEGEHRPGHFNGVGQIVSKLFDAVLPNKAYFGLKDFQQLAVIKKLVRDKSYAIEVVPCPIVREGDGLAMSSRNMLLMPANRASAPLIMKTLKELVVLVNSHSISKLKEYVVSVFEAEKHLDLEYIEIVDDNTLQPIDEYNPEVPITACIAVHAGKVRLIDNIQLNS